MLFELWKKIKGFFLTEKPKLVEQLKEIIVETEIVAAEKVEAAAHAVNDQITDAVTQIKKKRKKN
jgi:hypothetical protein